ncbi:hypothetical protein D3C85_1414700 [compost metagenome]
MALALKSSLPNINTASISAPLTTSKLVLPTALNINSVKDDAAGFNISTSTVAKINNAVLTVTNNDTNLVRGGLNSSSNATLSNNDTSDNLLEHTHLLNSSPSLVGSGSVASSDSGGQLLNTNTLQPSLSLNDFKNIVSHNNADDQLLALTHPVESSISLVGAQDIAETAVF